MNDGLSHECWTTFAFRPLPSPIIMADLVNSATPGGSWTKNELAAFNIEISLHKADDFFGRPQLPDPLLSDAILKGSTSLPEMSKNEAKFFSLMEDALPIPAGGQIFVVDFVAHLLSLMDYDDISNIIHRHKKTDLVVSGSPVSVEADVAVMKRFKSNLFYLFIVHEDQVCLLLQVELNRNSH
jgi:hypothetical protein